jgi:hypothetical protein
MYVESMSSESREELRRKLMDAIPSSYRPALHLASTLGVGLVTLVIALRGLSQVRAIELVTIPIVFVLANGFEWRVHRGLLHRRVKPLHELYDRHTPQHHMVFQHGDMAIRSARELRLVLMPAVGILGVVVGTAPVAWGVSRALGANVGWLFLVTAALYMVTYELTHLAYHLPEDGAIGRFPLIRVLREHHSRHHDPRLMQRWNFNVTVPLFDWLCGTLAPAELLLQAEADVPARAVTLP